PPRRERARVVLLAAPDRPRVPVQPRLPRADPVLRRSAGRGGHRRGGHGHSPGPGDLRLGEDAYAAFFTLALIVAIFRFLDRPREWHPAVILGLFAACFAAKETAYITAAVFGSFFVAVALWQVRRARASGRPARTAAIVATVRSVGLDAWIWGATAFAFIFTVLFSTFLFRPQGLRNGLYGSIQYWLSQQPVNRGGQPWFYYLVLIPFYELPVVLLALLGVAAALRRPTLFRAFLVWDAVACLVVYSWASERMPWLVLHPLAPL